MAEWYSEQEAEAQGDDSVSYDNPAEIANEAQAQEPEQPDIPEKYRGKSFEDVVRMHSEAEKLIGKHSQEVGELRRAVDTYIQQAMTASARQPDPEPEEDIDFFDDPKAAVSKAVATHPDVVEARRTIEQFKKTNTLSELQRKHPDMKEVLQDPSFAAWVQESKKRMQLYAEADRNYDYDAADELLSTYKQIKNMATEVQQTSSADRRNAVRSAGTGSAQGSGAKPPQKIYRRADIIKLMKNDPDRYDKLADEIQRAYAEGRVR